MNTSHNGNDYERLKEELRTLKRRGAPWYFESALHQRLHGGTRRRPRRRPIAIFPVLAVTFVTLCILGLAAYVVLLRTNLAFPGPHAEGPSASDSVSRVASGEAAHAAQVKTSTAVKPSPRVTLREAEAGRAPEDTQKTAAPAVHGSPRDTAAVRKDTASAVKDTVSHGPDSSASRVRPGRPD